MKTHMWRKLWAFLNQPLFEQNSAAIKSDQQLLERCWNTPYIQAVELDLQRLEHCWNIPYIQAIEPLQLLERCWNIPCVQPEYDR
ncbi:MAG: hypothetical protein IGS48_17785 [Oscillatoriales cyanobacterium C42_A2020_001]|nr:hypothetical protein [Leptolyngbyaceae cyanobacterium C42_A2020_001]